MSAPVSQCRAATEHTPTPWRYTIARWTPDAPACGFGIYSDYTHPGLPDGFKMHSIANANLSEQAAFTACFTPAEIEANAAFIVEAVNNYAALQARVEELTKALEQIASGTKDEDFPFRAMPREEMQRVASAAIKSCGAESNRHSGAVGADKRAEQSNPGGCHEVASKDDQKTHEQKPAGMNPRPAGVAMPLEDRK